MTDFEFDSNQVVDEAAAFIRSILYPCLNICMLCFAVLSFAVAVACAFA